MNRLYLFIFALLGLCMTGSHSAEGSAEESAVTPAVIEELLASARKWGVPEPPRGAGLVKVWAYESDDKPFYQLVFREPGDRARGLAAFSWVPLDKEHHVEVIPWEENPGLKNVTSSSPFESVHGLNFGLVTGIQLVWSGRRELGVGLIRDSLHADAGHHHSGFYSPAAEGPQLMLARSCLADAMNRISTSQPDFPAIKQRIDILLRDQPKLKSQATDWALKALDETLAYTTPKEGTIEALIHAYLLSPGVHGAMAHQPEKLAAKQRLMRTGFEAVPALIAQLPTSRLTSHIMQGFNNFPSYPMTSGQVVASYLQELANKDLGLNWLDKQKGAVTSAELVSNWWEEASNLGEKEYARRHLVNFKKQLGQRISEPLLAVVETRYPELLPEIYQRLIAREGQSWTVGEVLLNSERTSAETKQELFLKAIRGGREHHRNQALGLLRELSPRLADRELVRLLKKAPNDAKGEYWTDDDAALGRHVSQSRSIEVWQALIKLIDRAELGMQMELIAGLRPTKKTPVEALKIYHQIYQKFAEDRRVRDESTSEKFSGPGAGFPYGRIEMRDFIHLHWAGWMDMEIERPDDKGKQARAWKKFRAAVRAEIAARQVVDEGQ